MSIPAERVTELLLEYGDPAACMADLVCDRHGPDVVAFNFVDADLSSEALTFGELADRSKRVAAGLAAAGVGRRSCVATLMGKSPDLVATVLAIWRLGAIHVPLFTAFAPPAIALRLRASDTIVVVADEGQRHKLDPSESISARAPWTVVTAGGRGRDGDLHLDDMLAELPIETPAVAVGCDGPVVQIYTSGTTGPPKGVAVPMRWLASTVSYLELGLYVTDDDVYWNAADPGWAYGLYYTLMGPMAMGRTSMMLRAGFAPDVAWNVIRAFGVTNFTAAPTIYRALRGVEIPDDLQLRRCSSAGEPLEPDVIAWAEAVLGVPIHDHYGQTELGMIVMNAHHPDLRRPLHPGSMGHAAPGTTVEILDEQRDEIATPGTVGRVVVDTAHSPLYWFDGYEGDVERNNDRYAGEGRWYVTGDVASRDEDGYFSFSSRDDDVIIMAGYRIGPFEVESVVAQHPAVAEVAVIGAPDGMRGEVVEAYVVLVPGSTAGVQFDDEIKQLVKGGYAAHAYPRRIHVVDALPKTPSGKVKRFELRAMRQAEIGIS